MSTDVLIGTELAGHRIDDVIGRGGGGWVYSAEHLRLGRTVALKLLPIELSTDATFRQRFILESRTAATLHHPGIVTVYDAGEADGRLYLSMQRVRGTDLSQVLKREGVMDPARLLPIASQVAAALDAAHERGFVHRDVKPANILVEPQDDDPPRVYLSDFGIAKPIRSAEGPTRTGEFVGTINYVAPEQIKGEPLDGRADQYSLACVVVECLTGEAVFPREVGVAAIYAHLGEPPPSVHERRADLPPAVDRVITRALAKDPLERYETCSAFIEAFAEAVDAPTASRSSGTREVRKTVSVVCMDLGGSEDSTARREDVGTLFDRAKASLERHGGTLMALPGDALVAVFGVPVLHEDDALRAVRAASEAREALTDYEDLVSSPRIAVNTGTVIAEDASAGAAVAAGDAINVAIRLQQVAEPGEILLADTTISLVRDAVEVEPAPVRSLSDETTAVSASRLVHVTGARGIARRLDVPIVGRSRELGMLAQAFDRCASDEACHLFTVLGLAGVGKTRLVEAFLHDLNDRARIVQGRCLSYGEGITYWPLVEVLGAAAGLGPDDAVQDVRSKLETAGGPATDPRVIDRLELVLGMSELDVTSEEISWAVRRFFEALASDRPLVVSIDDLHWGEPTFLDLVERLAGSIRGVPVLLLCQARPELLEQRPGWAGGKVNATSILLEPLTRADADILIDALLGGGGLEETARDRITEAAGGMPLYLEQVLSMLLERGALRREGDTWMPIHTLDDLEVPASIENLILARIDLLEPSERLVLERASLIGQVFSAEAVGHLADLGPGHIDGVLTSLSDKDLIRPVLGELGQEDAYRFGHILVVNAAYNRLTAEARAHLHERFADWLEMDAEQRPIEVDEFVGYHLEQACRYRRELGGDDEATIVLAERAAENLVSSGERALGRSDHRAANGLLRRALALVPEHHPIAVRAATLHADGLYELGDLVAVRDVVAGLPERARSIGDVVSAARAKMVRVLVMVDSEPGNSIATAVSEMEVLLDDLLAVRDHGVLAECLMVLGILRLRNGDGDGALEAHVRGLDEARSSGRMRSLHHALTAARVPLVWGPIPTSAAIDRAQELRDEGLSHGLLMHWLDEGIAALTAMRGDFDEVDYWLRGINEMIEGVVADSEPTPWVSTDSYFGAEVLLHAGQYERLEQSMRSDLETMRSIGAYAWVADSGVYLGEALLGQGRFEEALDVTDLVEQEARLVDEPSAQIGWKSVRAEALAGLGRDLMQAEALARAAVNRAHQTDLPLARGSAHRSLAVVLLALGRDAEARMQRDAALREYETKEDVVMIGRVRADLAET